MDTGVKVATVAEMCAAKASGQTILVPSIGGAAAGIDLSSSAVADRFVATIVPILKKYNDFDGIDIDIETGLVGSGSIGQLSTSQANLIRIIDGVLSQMPANFGLSAGDRVRHGRQHHVRLDLARICRSSRSTRTTGACGG